MSISTGAGAHIATLESILFVANRPMSVKKLMEATGLEKEEVQAALTVLEERYGRAESGLRLMRHGDDVQMATSPECTDTVQQFLREETTGELTKASLETLTIIAYRGPLTKAELEQIRGVNCTIILRNLMMRGLIDMKGDAKDLQATYSVTVEFLRFLGTPSVEALPEYERLRSHESVVSVLTTAQEKPQDSPEEKL